MSCDLRVSLTIKCSKSNSDVIRVLRYPRKHWRPTTGTKTSPRAGRRLIFGYQVFSGNYTVSFKWNSRVGGKRRPVGSSAKVAVTKPNLADGSNYLELEAATKAVAPDKCWRHWCCLLDRQLPDAMIMYRDVLPLYIHDENWWCPDLKFLIDAGRWKNWWSRRPESAR
jgi:hypothetical protein